MLESLFNKVAGLKTCSFIKERLQHRRSPVNIAIFFYRTPPVAVSVLSLFKVCSCVFMTKSVIYDGVNRYKLLSIFTKNIYDGVNRYRLFSIFTKSISDGDNCYKLWAIFTKKYHHRFLTIRLRFGQFSGMFWRLILAKLPWTYSFVLTL